MWLEWKHVAESASRVAAVNLPFHTCFIWNPIPIKSYSLAMCLIMFAKMDVCSQKKYDNQLFLRFLKIFFFFFQSVKVKRNLTGVLIVVRGL